MHTPSDESVLWSLTPCSKGFMKTCSTWGRAPHEVMPHMVTVAPTRMVLSGGSCTPVRLLTILPPCSCNDSAYQPRPMRTADPLLVLAISDRVDANPGVQQGNTICQYMVEYICTHWSKALPEHLALQLAWVVLLIVGPRRHVSD